jgi:hypothetical protein
LDQHDAGSKTGKIDALMPKQLLFTLFFFSSYLFLLKRVAIRKMPEILREKECLKMLCFAISVSHNNTSTA